MVETAVNDADMGEPLRQKDSVPQDVPRADFDDFAAEYDAGMADPIKRLLGGTFETFFDYKAAWLQRTLQPTGRLLDFGCGEGGFLRALRQSGAPLDLVGCDVSGGMLAVAVERWSSGPLPSLHTVSPHGLPFGDGEFDVVTMICVLHHIKKPKRLMVVQELMRVVRPGGRLVVFEHNPRNPGTRWLMARALIDAGVDPVPDQECRALLHAAGAASVHTDYIVFFPPRFRRLWPTERFLRRVPFGGQYVTVAMRPPQ